MSDLIFLKNLHDHQYLINIMKNNRNENGVCTLEMKELSIITSKSLSWIKHAIKRINLDDVCIVKSKAGFSLNYFNLIEKGTFHNIFILNQQLMLDQTLVTRSTRFLRKKYGFSVDTIKLFKAYMGEG